VSKFYILNEHISSGLKNILLHLPGYLRDLQRKRIVHALREVSFDIVKGNSFGIIGRNGSGKSTILGLIAGVLKPSSGIVQVTSRISALLELGAGFHPELSGKDNIVLNGVLLGMSRREVKEKSEAIISFSGLGDFIDQPLRTYSSGMIARLGFSIVVHLDPQILLIDEVLAVGDEEFQKKCIAELDAFRSNGVTIVFVSHDLASVERICDRAALIDNGKLIDLAEPVKVIAEYRSRFR
jgi:lipopolysaccharide transport system ATP-binding protein